MKRENLIFLSIGLAAGFLFTMSSYDLIEAAIPPTNAISRIFIDYNDTGEFFPVKSTKYNDDFFYVSDGSIIFNATNSFP